ncbi:MAG: hypothetical protein ACRELD_05830 [Longimicrobiales bacterium]
MNRLVLSTTLLALATPLIAQQDEIRRADLPPRVEAELLDMLEDPTARKLTGPATIAADEVVSGDVVVTGSLRLLGRIDGDLAVIGGELRLEPGARVAGDVTVIGAVDAADGSVVDGTLTAYADAEDDRWRGRRPRRGGPDPDDESDWGEWRDGRFRRWGTPGRASFGFRLGAPYNRVEGLPIGFGPELSFGWSNPFRLTAHAIWRTESSSFEPQQMGYDVLAEQRIGRTGLRFGGGAYSIIESIEDAGVRNLEASLSSVLFHLDQRDYFERAGWRAFVGWDQGPVDLTLTYRDDEHLARAAGDPWTLFDNDAPWRAQPLVAEGDVRSVTGTVRFGDSREYSRWGGLAVVVSGTHGLGGSLALPARSPEFADVVHTPFVYAERFTAGEADVRFTTGAGWNSQLAVRAYLAGTPGDDALPPQFQHALGGIGSLPGYSIFEADCAARTGGRVHRAGGGSPALFYPVYGCDRVALLQAEYRGRIDFGFDFDGWDWDDDEDEWSRARARAQDWHEDWHGWDLDFEPQWVVFFDAGQGWSNGAVPGASRRDTGVLYDAGLGLMFGDVGVYWAVPFGSDSAEGSNVFIRLGHRF